MKRISLWSIAVIVIIAFSAACACAQSVGKYRKNGISFDYVKGSLIEEESERGKYDIVHCSSPEGCFFSLTVFRDDTDCDTILSTYKSEFAGQFRKKGATSLKFSDIEETFRGKITKGWLLTFTLNSVAFENRTFSLIMNGKSVCFTRQFTVDTRAQAGRFFEPILSTLSVK